MLLRSGTGAPVSQDGGFARSIQAGLASALPPGNPRRQGRAWARAREFSTGADPAGESPAARAPGAHLLRAKRGSACQPPRNPGPMPGLTASWAAWPGPPPHGAGAHRCHPPARGSTAPILVHPGEAVSPEGFPPFHENRVDPPTQVEARTDGGCAVGHKAVQHGKEVKSP